MLVTIRVLPRLMLESVLAIRKELEIMKDQIPETTVIDATTKGSVGAINPLQPKTGLQLMQSGLCVYRNHFY
jgi:hypothetical protein